MKGLRWHDFLLMGICVVILIGVTVFFVMNYAKIPEVIPTNFDFQGNVTGTGGKGNAVFLLVMAWFLPIIMISTSFFPNLWNIPAVKPQNYGTAIIITRKMMEVISVLMALFLGYLLLSMCGLIPMISAVFVIFSVLLAAIIIVPMIFLLRLK
ncbi:MAG: DUF1648 domain-containing protein [Clostridiales bacterium]|nr:DUF1648 domain-containing protein [Clostridiales bacterium]